MKRTAVLIIGQGLAGSVLAHALRSRGVNFMVIAQPALSHSSAIAAGIWNPVVFKRMTLSWKAGEVIPAMHAFYSETEKFLGAQLITRRKMIKFFSEQQEAELWKKKSEAELKGFTDPLVYRPGELHLEGVARPAAGFSFVTESGNLDTARFLDATRRWLVSENRYAGETFDHAALQQTNGILRYKNIEAEKVIFCEGWLNRNNPFFGYIPFKPAKGEVFTFRCPALHTDYILNKGVFVLPLGKRLFKCGATYQWNEPDDRITAVKQDELEQKLRMLLTLPYEVTERRAGVRPSVIDRRPLLGVHPAVPGLYIFNGFGTKAVMLAPYFAGELLNFISGKKALSPEADVARFAALHGF